ncbi:MAG: flavodoxin domain-containing protein [Planctomycetota bacterium]
MKIGIIYGTSMGNTQDVAEQIKEYLGDAADDPVEVIRFDPPDIARYDVLLLGIPTWHVGEMQDDWEDAAEKYNIPEMQGKKVGFFGCGDQAGYPTTFGDAFGHLWDIIEPAGLEPEHPWQCPPAAARLRHPLIADECAEPLLDRSPFVHQLLAVANETTKIADSRWCKPYPRQIPDALQIGEQPCIGEVGLVRLLAET